MRERNKGATMRYLLTCCATAIALAMTSTHAAAEVGAGQPQSGSRAANQYICVFDGSVDKAQVHSAAHGAVGPEMGQILHTYENTIRGFAVRLPASTGGSEAAIDRIKAARPEISQCIPDGITRAAQRRPGGGGGGGGGGGSKQQTPWGVARVGTGDAAAIANRAWVIDSGIDLDHKDLNVDLVNAYSVVSGGADDGYGHGTHVAGTIAAKNNNFGVVGVAAGARVVPVRVLNSFGYGPDSGVIEGIDYAAGKAVPGDVINLSLVADTPNSAMDLAVAQAGEKGIYVVMAAGNDASSATLRSPGRTSGLNLFTVSAFDSSDRWASFSNFGNPPIDYGEPGVSIYSTDKNGRYGTRSGTSMAAPHLSGILLLKQALPASGGTVINDPDGTADTIGVR